MLRMIRYAHIWIALIAFAPWATAIAGSLELSKERLNYLEGVWKGVPAETSADKLCSKTNPPPGAATLSFEFARSGGVAFADDGETAVRELITEANEENGVMSLTFGGQVWRLRPDSDKIMSRVRSSASLGGDMDTMVLKRCAAAADSAAISLDTDALKFLASDLPGDEAYFIDERIAPKTGNRCSADETQYVFFALIGPAEFRLSRWNSFALADKLAAKQTVKLTLDRVADWRIESAKSEGGKYVIQLRDYDDAKAPPQTIHLEPRAAGISIPEWKRKYIRCTGFQSRS